MGGGIKFYDYSYFCSIWDRLSDGYEGGKEGR